MQLSLTGSATAFVFETGGMIKTGKLDNGFLVGDDETRWNWWSATAIEGPQKGKTLTRAYALPSSRRAWLDFHPGSQIAGEPDR